MSQADAKRIGICLNDYEQFWWRAEGRERTCPVCSTDDVEYESSHRFYVLETAGMPGACEPEAVQTPEGKA